MLEKREINFIKGFLIEYKMTQKELAKEAGICEKTLYNALHSGKIRDVTYNKILSAMLAEESQREIIKEAIEEIKTPNYLYRVLKICWMAIGALIALMLLNSLFN